MRTKKRRSRINLKNARNKEKNLVKKGLYQVERQLHRPKNENKQSSNI